MPDRKRRHIISDLTGGRNGFDPPWEIGANECIDAVNVDWYGTPFARKRGGAANQSGLSGQTTTGKYSSLFRHVPGTDPTVAEMWATDDSGTPVINRLAGGTAWAAPTLKDAPTGNGWDFSGASINGMFALAYKSAQGRLHMWDGSTVRRAGLAAPVAPTAANQGSSANIAFDAASTLNFGATTTVSHTCAAGATLLMVGIRATAVVTAVTYNGVAMTQITTSVLTDNYYLFYLASPSSGANNIAITTAGNVGAAAASWTGTGTTGIPDAFQVVSGGSPTLTGVITTITNNDWVAFFVFDRSGTAPTASTNTTARATPSAGTSMALFDSNLNVTPPQAFTQQVTVAGVVAVGIQAAFPAGSVAYQSIKRYYRVRWTRQSGGITIGRSEPGASVTFTPNGSGTAARVTQPTVANEGETHWEVEASTDNVTFYRIATVVIGTTTYDDSAVPNTYNTNPLSAATGFYALQKSYKFIATDQGRLIGFGSYTSTDKQNDIEVSAVIGSSDIGDHERVDQTTNYRIGLDENDSGIPTGLMGPVLDTYLAFKDRQTWLLTPNGTPSQPYNQRALSKSVGAVCATAMDKGEDAAGNPCVYFMSHRGMFRWGLKGLEYIGRNVEDYVLPGANSVAQINLAAAKNVAVVRFYPDKRQVWCWWATGSSDDPNQGFIYDIITGGWSRIPTGDKMANVRCAVMFSNTIGATMSRDLKPYVGQTGGNNLLWKADTGTDDASTNFQAYVITRDEEPGGPGFLGEIGNSVLLAKAASGVTITDTVTANFGAPNSTATGTALLTALGSETRVSKELLESGMNNVGFAHHQIGDASAVSNAWTLERLIVPLIQRDAESH